MLNNNQLGVILQANSGLPFNIRSNLDLNLDGVTNDRPLGIERNAGRLGRVVNLDLRYSRFIPFCESRSASSCSSRRRTCSTRENIAGVNRVVTTDASGNPRAPIPNPFPPSAGYDQRRSVGRIGFRDVSLA